jgi:hypothetical protein
MALTYKTEIYGHQLKNVSGSLVFQGLFGSPTGVYILNPTTVGPATITNIKNTTGFSSDLTVPTAANYLNTAWATGGWTLVSLVEQLNTFINNNINGAEQNQSYNFVIIRSTIAGSGYTVVLIYAGNNGPLVKWPFGSLGDLTIANGQTVNIAAGSIRDYNNLTIQTGGTLNIQGGATGAITSIGVAGNCIIDGVIKGNDGIFATSTFNTTTPDLESISYTINQQSAGAGGRGGGSPGADAAGTAGTLGIGGGGSGAGGSSPPNLSGTGGTDGAPGGAGSPGSGAGNVTLGNGGNTSVRAGASGGGSGGGAGAPTAPNGGGGGGGYKGKHGLGLYLYCKGTITGSGQIQLNGQNGFNGGINNAPAAVAHGGAGGGGAGGSGGALWVRSPGPFSVPYTVSAGTGGLGGVSTPGTGPLTPSPGQDANAGQDGSFNYAPK